MFVYELKRVSKQCFFHCRILSSWRATFSSPSSVLFLSTPYTVCCPIHKSSTEILFLSIRSWMYSNFSFWYVLISSFWNFEVSARWHGSGVFYQIRQLFHTMSFFFLHYKWLPRNSTLDAVFLLASVLLLLHVGTDKIFIFVIRRMRFRSFQKSIEFVSYSYQIHSLLIMFANSKVIKISLLFLLLLVSYWVGGVNRSYISIFTNPSARAGYDTRLILKRSLTGLNSEFSFS